MNLIEKIQSMYDHWKNLRADPIDLGTIDAWLAEAKRLFLIQSLKGHDGIKYVLEVFEKEVAQINEKLKSSYSKDLPDKERDRLLDKRDLAQKYLNLFSGVDEQLAKIEEDVDKSTI